MFIEEHEKAMAEYLDQNPGADEEEAYECTLDLAHVNMTERMADQADRALEAWKERGL